MPSYLLLVALILLLLLAAGMVRVLRGPTDADRMMAAQLFGTQATAILLLLAAAFGKPAIVDIALVLALLAVVATIAFLRRPIDTETRNDIG